MATIKIASNVMELFEITDEFSQYFYDTLELDEKTEKRYVKIMREFRKMQEEIRKELNSKQ